LLKTTIKKIEKKKKKKKKKKTGRTDMIATLYLRFMQFFARICTSHLVGYILCSVDRTSLYNLVNETNFVRNILYS